MKTNIHFRFLPIHVPLRAAIGLFLSTVWCGPASTGTPTLEPGGDATVIEIVDGDTLRLADGQQVRLVGLQAPKLPLGRPNFKAWPLGDEAKAALAELTLHKRIQLSYGGRKSDRYGRLLAHLHDSGGVWIQGEMLRRGLARVYSFPDNRHLVGPMLAAEREARIAGRGIWGHEFYRIRQAERLEGDNGTFQLIEGRVRDVATVRGRTYLNFGADWRKDFTIAVSPRDRRRFEKATIGLTKLKGRLVRVRGWLIWRNGPMIEATHPEQLEVLE
ncbi:MAG: thermonuclease family protein [Rickettsiales bacterium]